jgi:AcrR family transcriptional regulator
VPTQDERKAETRARLLGAAADLFARQGVHATSADAIAERAERTSGALYAHFGGKQGLVLALLDGWEAEVARSMRSALDDARTSRERAAALWDRYANAPLHSGTACDADSSDGNHRDEQPDHQPDHQLAEQPADTWRLLEHELLLQAARDPELATRLASRYGSARRQMADAIDHWGSSSSGLVSEHAATAVLALLLGLDLQRRLDPDAVTDELATTALAALLGGS